MKKFHHRFSHIFFFSFFTFYLLQTSLCFSRQTNQQNTSIAVAADSVSNPADTLIRKNVSVPVKVTPVNAEKLAWNLMLPNNYKKEEKTFEARAYEQMLQQVQKGVAELSAMVDEFDLSSFQSATKPRRKKSK